MSYSYLGMIYVNAHRPDLALEPAQKAIALFESLPGEAARGNLSAALGDLANAYSALGRYDEALQAAERALAIDRDLGREREIAAGLGRTAAILTQQGRYAEADARYGEALEAARAAGDLGLQGTLLQHRGSLQRQQGHHERAVDLFRQAIDLFQRAGDRGGEMRTCDLLASAERQRGHLDAAEAWYARARELAEAAGRPDQLAVVAQNVGILYQTRAEGRATQASARRPAAPGRGLGGRRAWRSGWRWATRSTRRRPTASWASCTRCWAIWTRRKRHAAGPGDRRVTRPAGRLQGLRQPGRHRPRAGRRSRRRALAGQVRGQGPNWSAWPAARARPPPGRRKQQAKTAAAPSSPWPRPPSRPRRAGTPPAARRGGGPGPTGGRGAAPGGRGPFLQRVAAGEKCRRCRPGCRPSWARFCRRWWLRWKASEQIRRTVVRREQLLGDCLC